VQHGAGGQQFPQSYLAAFDRDTGEWISSFTPKLDGTVWDLVGTPDGKLIVAGQFTNINGVPNTSALAELDPVSGAVITTWQASLALGVSDTDRPMARALDIEGNFLYVGGNFARITGTNGVTVSVARFARVALADGAVDLSFRPDIEGGQVVDLDATPTRLYLAGWFTSYDGTPVEKIAVVDLSTKQLVPGLAAWTPTVTNGRDYQQVIQEHGQNVFQGGSEHDFQIHDRDTYNLVQQYIPTPGGDFQAEAEVNGVVYASCHCNNFVYTGATAWPGLNNFQRADRITYILAVDAATGKLLNQFQPEMHSANTEGVWELFADSKGCLWFGGDENQGALINGVRQWLGSFGRFCPPDQVAPTPPTGVSVSPRTAGGNQITWSGGTDNVAGNLSYEVLRNDRVISPVLFNTFVYNDTAGQLGDRYFVRTVDAAGNRSATTSVVLPSDTVKPTVPTNLSAVATANPGEALVSWDASTDNFGVAGYRIYRNGALFVTAGPLDTSLTIDGLPSGSSSIQISAFDAAGNESAKTAPVTVVPTQPDTTKPSVPTGLSATATANSGEAAVSWNASTDNVGVQGYRVYCNGTLWVTVLAPATSTTLTGLPSGTSLIQVSAIDAAGNESDKTAAVSVVPKSTDTTKPTVPTNLNAVATSHTGEAYVSWDPSTDDVEVTGYHVYRNSVLWATTGPTPTSVTLTGLPSGNSSIQVSAFDAAGNESALTAAVVVAPK
jgi:hypothetical protein